MRGKRVLSIILSLAMIITFFAPVKVQAAIKNASLTVEEGKAVNGDTVEVKVEITNNPGIMGAVIKVEYDDGLELIDSKSGDAFAGMEHDKTRQICFVMQVCMGCNGYVLRYCKGWRGIGVIIQGFRHC